MQEKPNVEELIAESMTLLLIRAQKLPKRERLAISQEFREWIYGETIEEDVLVIDNLIK